MASLGDLFWELRARDTKLTADITAAGGKAGAKAGTVAGQSFSARFTQSMKGISKGGGIQNALLGGVGLGAGLMAFQALKGAVSGVTDAITGAVRAAAEEQVQLEKLGVALKANIPEWDGNLKAIEDVIIARERLGFSDDEQMASLAKLVAITKDSSAALDLQRQAMDLARLRSIDLDTAATVMGKVFMGNTTILKRYGIAVAKGSSATQALAAIQKQTSGQAEAYSKTFAGREKALALEIDHITKALGAMLMGPATDFIGFLGNIIAPAKSGNAALATLNEKLVAMAKHLHEVNAAANGDTSANGQMGHGTVFGSFLDGLDNMVDLVNPGGHQLELWTATMAEAGAAIGLTSADLSDLAYNVREAGGSLVDFQHDVMDLVAAQLRADSATKVTISTFGNSTDVLRGLITEWNAIGKVDAGGVVRFGDSEVAAYLSGLDESTRKALLSMKDLPGLLRIILQDAPKANAAVKPLTTTLAEAGAAMSKAFADVGPLVTASFKTIPSKIKGGADKIKVIWDHALTTTLSDIKLRMKEINYALANPHQLSDTRKALVKAENEAWAARKRAKKHHNVEAFALADAEYQYLKGVVAAIDKLTATVHVDWAVENARKAIKRAWNLDPTTAYSGIAPPRRAGGGPVQRGMPYVVGERRPEVFVPETNGYIRPSTGTSGASRVDFYVHDVGGGLARAGISTADLANQLRRWDG